MGANKTGQMTKEISVTSLAPPMSNKHTLVVRGGKGPASETIGRGTLQSLGYVVTMKRN